MSYTRYQRLSPDLQTEWGTFTNPHITFAPNEYKFRQPGVPLLASGRSDVIHPSAMAPQHLGYIGDYVPGPMGDAAAAPSLLGGDTLKTILIMAAVGLVLYFLFKGKSDPQANPCVSDFNALLDSGWMPPDGLAPAARTRRRSHTRAGLKSLSRRAQTRARDASGKFI